MTTNDAERIDAYAAGSRRDPGRYFTPLTGARLAAYFEARCNGFVDATVRPAWHLRHYRAWCLARNVPYVAVFSDRGFCGVEYDAETTGYPATCRPGAAFAAWFEGEVRRRWVPESSSMMTGEDRLWAWGLRRNHAEAVAAGLWERARPHCVSTEERDRYLLRVWTSSGA